MEYVSKKLLQATRDELLAQFDENAEVLALVALMDELIAACRPSWYQKLLQFKH